MLLLGALVSYHRSKDRCGELKILNFENLTVGMFIVDVLGILWDMTRNSYLWERQALLLYVPRQMRLPDEAMVLGEKRMLPSAILLQDKIM